MEVILIKLLQYLRENHLDAMNQQIAKILVRNINHLDGLSLDELSSLCACSPSSFQRFLKQLGFSNYRLFSKLLQQPQAVYLSEGFSSEEYAEHIAENIKITKAEIESKMFEAYVQEILQTKILHIVTFPTNQALTLEFQCKMALLGKEVNIVPYLSESNFEIKQEDFVLIISLKGNYQDEKVLQMTQHSAFLTANKAISLPVKHTFHVGKYFEYGEANYGLNYFFDCLYQAYYKVVRS